MDLVEGVRAKAAVVGRADEQQQADRLLAVSRQLDTQIYRHAADEEILLRHRTTVVSGDLFVFHVFLSMCETDV